MTTTDKRQTQSTIQYQLNDVAVSLLEQNCFCQAFDTFRDVRKCAELSNERGDICALEVAHKRLASLEPFPCTLSIKYFPISIQAIECLKNIDSLLAKLEGDGNSKSFLPIRFGVLQPGMEMTVELASAIIEYNLGIAHRAYAQALLLRRKTLAFNNSCRTATKSLESAASIMEKLSAKDAKDVTHRTLFVHMIVLLGLHDLVLTTFREEEVRIKLLAVDDRISSLLFMPCDKLDNYLIMLGSSLARECALFCETAPLA